MPRRAGRIDLHVDDPRQLLDMLDPFPFRERGLDPELEDYVEERAGDTPPGSALELAIHLPPEAAAGELARSLPEIVSGHFTRRAERASRDLARLFADGRTALAVGLVVLALCLGLGQFLVSLFPNSRLAAVAMEGLVILGWVANWHPMEIFLFEWWPLVKQRRLYRRLAAARVTLTPYPPADRPG
ncbi:hypothetical protein [Ancylobacter lacus]|uniref:hypothetical protein n=1 Tax=Ancylobacter lacus TaxID=2579970 RepID=UPI001BCF6624|nr:hypothetical protein [Ancylobacter lacus]MBS7539272.1 hypothetical protein [Ancylobacter lacus]